MPHINSAVEALQTANSYFVDENYEEALREYNNAIELDETNVDAFIKRSICNFKLDKFTESLADANLAIRLQPTQSKGYMRKGLAAFELQEYETAKAAFEQGQKIDPDQSNWRTWIRKCEAEMGMENTKAEKSEEKTNTTSPMIVDPPKVVPVTPTQPPSIPSQPKIRHEWYQTNSHAIVAIFAKNIKKEQVTIDIREKTLSVTIQMSNANDYLLEIDLFDTVVPQECTIEYMSTKIEIKLKKFAQYKWKDLEDKGDTGPKVFLETASTVSGPKPKKNWDKIVNEVAGTEPLDETDGLNKVFQDIFANGTEDQKKAMQKSFLESGGTVLSTNWDEVGKGNVKASPPDGMELHRWDEFSK